MKRLAVYCGSATPEDPIYIETARHVGRTLATRGIGVVYGGGRLGLMGAVADSALEAGGEVIGVIPDALVGTEVAHRGCTELHVVETMHQRKQLFKKKIRTMISGRTLRKKTFFSMKILSSRSLTRYAWEPVRPATSTIATMAMNSLDWYGRMTA